MAMTASVVIARTPGAEVEEFTTDDPGAGRGAGAHRRLWSLPHRPGGEARVYGSEGFPFLLGGNFRVCWYGDCLPTRDFPLLANLYR
jgi:hypothetical protein